MTLSVIIVSYNVKYFLEQCLASVIQAIGTLEAEILVVDNQSADGTLEYLSPRFPRVRFLANPENTGFARANNQALALAKGKYLLFLNPDTMIGRDCFEKCLEFLEDHPEAGSVGVRMIDGSGYYLKESKRGFPSPWVAFCKMAGLTALFPHSAFFAGYYLGHLPEKEIHEVDVLPGAYMMVKREVLDKTGGFDERFFMYAEDIDLSYRIQQAGFRNYYLPTQTILHFKGESTQKDIRYVKLFYKAMSQFVRKQFRKGYAGLFSVIMDFAIWLRAGFAALEHFFKSQPASKPLTRCFLWGHTGSLVILAEVLARHQRVLVSDKMLADEILFMEGEGLSFSDIIYTMEREKGKFDFKIHASQSGSLLGSSSRKIRGEVLPM